MFYKVLKKKICFFQHCWRNPSAKDETVKLYRRPRSFMHPAWMRVSGLIWGGHRCIPCFYKGRLFISLQSPEKLCADAWLLLIWIQLNAEGYWDWGTPRHKKSLLEKPLLVRTLKRYLSVQKDVKLCSRVVGLVPEVSKSEKPSVEILIFSRACYASPSTFV